MIEIDGELWEVNDIVRTLNRDKGNEPLAVVITSSQMGLILQKMWIHEGEEVSVDVPGFLAAGLLKHGHTVPPVYVKQSASPRAPRLRRRVSQ